MKDASTPLVNPPRGKPQEMRWLSRINKKSNKPFYFSRFK
jgi:hypothetical protein